MKTVINLYRLLMCGFRLDRQCFKHICCSNSDYQTDSYVLIALSEIFASITGLEYAFTKAPINMRSLVMSAFLFTSAIASAVGEAFVRM